MLGFLKKILLILIKIIVVPGIAVLCVWTAFQIVGGDMIVSYNGPGIAEWLRRAYLGFDFGQAGDWAASGQNVAPYIWQAVAKTGTVTLLAIALLTAVSLAWTYQAWRRPYSHFTKSGSMVMRFFSSWPILIGAIFMAVISRGQVFASIFLAALVLAICDNNLNDFLDNLYDEINSVLKSDYAIAVMGQGRSFLKNLGPELAWKILSFIATRLPVLVSGIIILELYFNINGIYRFLKMFYEARDLNAILGITFVVSLLMTSWNSLFTLVHAAIDPRQR
jgi:ABC-type dipeptide/oligopeptide/nickel transport system permease component